MLSSQTFIIRPLPTLVFGVGASMRLAEHVLSLKRRQALIVTDQGLVRAGVIAPILQHLAESGVQTLVFDNVEANPTDLNVEAGAEMLRQLDDAVVIAIGGGSAMDCGKAIALLGPNPGSLADLQSKPPAHDGAPVIAVATTAGTGSETNSACVITDTSRQRKTYVAHRSITPVTSVLDPGLTLKLPPYPTATCGFDVLTHAVEALTALRATPYSDGVALEAIRMVAQNVRTAVREPGNVEARSQMMLASAMAAIAFNVAGLGAAHGTGHALSARLNAAHGQTLATMLPHVITFNMPVASARYARAAEALGVFQPAASNEANAHNALAEIVAIRQEIGIERSIRDLGAGEALLDVLVEDAMNDPVNRSNPRPLEAADFAGLYRAAW